jgi:hypothetical protein
MFNVNDTVSMDYIQKYKDYSEKLLSVSNSIIVYDLIHNKESNQANNINVTTQ